VIAVDAPVLVDLLADGPQADAAEACLRQYLSAGPVVVCDVALAEICGALRVRFSAIEAKSALRAGEMQRRSWQRGDTSGRAARDFLVGAHALLQCNGLITRDDAFFRTYFKGLKLIVPSA